jgi:FkbH-like protein
MFIDDNPVEREAVKLNLPMVKVLDLPQDVTAYTDTFLDSPFIQSVRIGEEDRKRVASYKARKKINLERSSAASIENFLAGLDMQLFVQKLDGSNLARAAQLCQKTNQFNTTTRRHSARDLLQMQEQGVDVAVIGLQDKFTKLENIGLLILKPDMNDNQLGHVDLLLLSCRILGRTVEQAVVKWALGRAHRRGWGYLRGEVIETSRNTPARRVFADCGFDEIQSDTAEGQTLWQHAAENTTLPDWFAVHDAFTTQ